ncbi:MAG TPA: phosphoadenylyl-sulfate reductase [Candidatus Dormibacteraeota bacterium]|jgi:phosphoadenosine phosphosulfate reductase|nr:phosphoadenylyl-sulfate reductase [Candidatus Dormibacteraeota bacterium]
MVKSPSARELEAIADAADERLEQASAEEILSWAAETFGRRLCVTSSMADPVVLHLASRALPGIDVVFLDTGYHFAETLVTRDLVADTYDVNVLNVVPEQTVAEQDATHGARLHDRDPDLCCNLRKVRPLQRALEGYDAWITGLRRDESPSRAGTRIVAWDPRRGKVKISPIARWTEEQVEAYIAEHKLLFNPLLADGYASIGCQPCTRRTLPGEDPRSGRWAGLLKTECGIHFS